MRIFVAGATGFVGAHIVRQLVDEGHTVVGLARHPPRDPELASMMNFVQGDLALPLTYRGRLLGCGAAINAVGLLRERWDKRGVTYGRVVVQGTQNFVQECVEADVKHLVLISANGAAPEGTPYQTSKWRAEQAVRNGGRAWTILRPSLIHGNGRDFVRAFRNLLRLRIVPVWGRQDYFFEPVAATDVARVVSLQLRAAAPKNQVVHVGGPEQFTFREMLDAIRSASGTRAWLVPTPRWVGHVATTLFGWLPFFPATRENLRLLLRGNVVPDHAWATRIGTPPMAFRAALAARFGRNARG